MGHQFETFNDDMAKLVLDGAQKMGGGYLGELIFGNQVLGFMRVSEIL